MVSVCCGQAALMGQGNSVEEQLKDKAIPCIDYKDGRDGVFYCDGKCRVGFSVWGVGPYTADSGACRAARHAGVIDPGKSGFFVVDKAEGLPEYGGSAQHGITSFSFGAYPRSINVSRPDLEKYLPQVGLKK